MAEQITPVEPTSVSIIDFYLALPDEGTYESVKEAIVGDIDVIGSRNGKFLVNVRGSIPDELMQYNLTLDVPLRVWA